MPFGKHNPPILAQIVLLVAAAIAAALLAMLFITFRGPPPRPAPAGIQELAQAVTGPRQAEIPLRDRVIRTHFASSIEVPPGLFPDPTATRALSGATGLPLSRIQVYSEERGDGSPPYGLTAPMGGDMALDGIRGNFLIAVGQKSGWLLYKSVEQPMAQRWFLTTSLAMMAIFFGLLVPVWLVARHITRPLRQFAAHVSEQTPAHAVPVPLSGPPETRRLFQAFNDMQNRLSGYIEERTAMLAAIAHDLRTPLTRLSFRLDSLPDNAREKAQADIAEMREMITSVLEFVKGSAQPYAMTRVDAAALVETLVDDLADMGKPVTLCRSDRAVIMADGAALRRCFGNIIENALRYAGDTEISVDVESGSARIAICDRGPGIAQEHLPHVFEPFYRGEQSRNRQTGGAGLGMAIARNIAERHGGAIDLALRDGGGLRVEIRLPLALS